MSWNCARCSFSNHPDLRYCELCEFAVDSDVRSTSVSSAKVISLVDSPCGTNTSDHYILPQDIRKHTSNKELVELRDPVENVVANNLSHEQQKQSRTLLPIQGCAHAVPGILQLIRQSMTTPSSARSKVRCEYVVSSPPCLHVSQKGSYGSAWSCGYRNIQMLCSSLMQLEEYRNVLFDGTGVVPEINGIQRWIETAWKAGFDVEARNNSYSSIYSILTYTYLLFFYLTGRYAIESPSAGLLQMDWSNRCVTKILYLLCYITASSNMVFTLSYQSNMQIVLSTI